MQNVKECVHNHEYLCYGNNLVITPCMVKNAIFMLGQIALSENVTTVPWVFNYICFMHIVVQLIVANYGLTLIRAHI